MELLVFTEVSVNLKEVIINVTSSDVIQHVSVFHDKERHLLKLGYEAAGCGMREVGLARVEGTPLLQQRGIEVVEGRTCVRVSLEKCTLFSLTTSMLQGRGVGDMRMARGGERLEISCKLCGEKLTRDGGARMRRIRPFPSEGWENMAGEWFCHEVHDAEGKAQSPMDRIERMSLKPAPEDLFYSEMFYTLSGASIPKGTRRQIELGNKREGLTVTCGGCDQLLGSEYEECVELYQSEVELRFSPLAGAGVQVFRRSVERMVGRLCRSLRMDGHVSKVIIKPFEADPPPLRLPAGMKEHWPTPRVLGFLWLLEPDWQVSVFSSRAKKTQYESGRVVQVMYLTRVEGRERIDAFPWELWLSDPQVYKLEIPYQLSLELFQQLLRSTCLLPPGHRRMGACMRLGFLRAE